MAPRRVIGEMDILVAQLSSELKFIKKGMLPAVFIDSTVHVRTRFPHSVVSFVKSSLHLS